MEVPSWVGKVATGVALTNPITAPIVLGKWMADKATSVLGPKTEAAPVQVTPAQPQAPAVVAPKPQPVAEGPGDVKPAYDRDTKAQAPGKQPLYSQDGKWNGADILNGQTQVSKDDPSSKTEQDHRCGPSAVLGAAVMSGPEATGKLVDNLHTKASAKDQPELDAIKGRLDSKQATHEDLSRLQHIMYNTYHPADQKDPNLSQSQLGQMQKDLSGATQSNTKLTDFGGRTAPTFQYDGPDDSYVVESPDRMQRQIQNLKPGQSFVDQVDSTSNQKGLDHYVLVGKDKEGRSYVYDSGGKTNQPQVVYQDQRPQAFNQYTGGAMGGMDNGRPAVVRAGGVATN